MHAKSMMSRNGHTLSPPEHDGQVDPLLLDVPEMPREKTGGREVTANEIASRAVNTAPKCLFVFMRKIIF